MRRTIRISAFNESIESKEVIDWINDCCGLDPTKDQLFLNRIVALNTNSLGIKKSESPFNIHKKVTEKYIKEIFNLSDNQINDMSSEGTKILGPKMVRIYIESAQRLVNKSPKECNPYFRLYLNTYSRDNRLISKSKPFVSNSVKNTLNPKWETKLDIEVPDSVTEDLTKVYRNEISIEIWSQSPKISCYERLFHRFFGYEFDEYLGSVYLTIGKRSSLEDFFTYHIPSTSSVQILPLSDESEGWVTIKTVWGRRAADAEHRIFLKHHILLYFSSLKWQINHLKSSKRTEDFSELMRTEDLTWLTFLYMPALSLLNQHKIQSNLSTYEDYIIRRIVLIELIIRHKSGDNVYENRVSVLLAKVLANEDIKRKPYTAWLSKDFIVTLNHIEKHFVLKLIEESKREIKLVTNQSIDQKNVGSDGKSEAKVDDSLPLKRLLYILKSLRKYHRKYRDLNIKQTINLLIGTEIIEWIKKHIDFKVWSQIISSLAVLAEYLRDYWYRLDLIVDSQEVNKILTDLKKSVKQMTEQWKSDQTNEQLSEDILNFFLFLTELNEFFPNRKETESTEPDSSEQTMTEEIEIDSEGQNKPIEENMKQIKVNDFRKRSQIDIKLIDLKFSQFLKPNENENKIFWKDFDEEIFRHWIAKREKSLESFVKQMVERYKESIENFTDEQIKELIDGRIATKFFFNSVSQLVYFSLAVSAKHNWNYKKFTDILNKLCTICYQFCHQLKDKICLESDDNQHNSLYLKVFCLNAIDLMQRIHLRTDLLEVITDIKATHIRTILSQTQEVNQTLDQNSNQFELWSQAFKCCKYIDSVANEIQEIETEITDQLSDQTVRQIHRHLSDVVNSYPDISLCDSKYQTIEKLIDKTFEIINEKVSRKQLICDIVLKIKMKISKVIDNQLEHIFKVFKQIETIEEIGIEDKMKKVVKLFAYLAKKYEDLNEKTTQFVSKLLNEEKFVSEKREEFEGIDKMGKYMLNSIKEKVKARQEPSD